MMSQKKMIYEEILRIRNIISENELGYSITKEDGIDYNSGICIKIFSTKSNDLIGAINIAGFDLAKKLDPDILRFFENKDEYCVENCDDNFFNNDNTIYSHSLEVEEPFRKMGFGTILKQEIEKVAKDLGYDYITSIVSCNNHASQNLNKKLNYSVSLNNGKKDFLYKKID